MVMLWDLACYLFTERLPPGDGHQSRNTPAFDLISKLITDKLLALGENFLVTGIRSTSSPIHFLWDGKPSKTQAGLYSSHDGHMHK